jgi:hypothetical protein
MPTGACRPEHADRHMLTGACGRTILTEGHAQPSVCGLGAQPDVQTAAQRAYIGVTVLIASKKARCGGARLLHAFAQAGLGAAPNPKRKSTSGGFGLRALSAQTRHGGDVGTHPLPRRSVATGWSGTTRRVSRFLP